MESLWERHRTNYRCRDGSTQYYVQLPDNDSRLTYSVFIMVKGLAGGTVQSHLLVFTLICVYLFVETDQIGGGKLGTPARSQNQSELSAERICQC